MNSPAAICAQLEAEERERQPRVDLNGTLERRRSRDAVPVTPTPEIVREAECDAAEAQHALAMAGPDCGRLDVLRVNAEQTRARAHRLRQALADG